MRDMLGREELISVERALELLFNCAPFCRPPVMATTLDLAYGMVTSTDILSPEDLPSFNRSTVDGYAVNAAETYGATDNLPSYLTIKSEIFMGEKPAFSLKQSEAAKIATGGMLPGGTNAVVMFEHTQQIDETMIEVVRPVSPGENVIQAGEDAQKGALILRSGHKLRPQDIGVLAGLGITKVPVLTAPALPFFRPGMKLSLQKSRFNPDRLGTLIPTPYPVS